MRTVLVIDDDRQYRSLVAEFLQQNGWQVLEASEGEEGIKLAKAHHPDSVVCDLLMPRCNGFKVCQELRSTDSLRRSRILVTSGRDFESDRQAAMKAGADAYLTKPINLSQLLVLLGRFQTEPPSEPVPAGAVHAQLQTTWLKFWGVRGSVPTPGPGTVRYGGNTSCVEVRADGQILILDAGTGLRLLGRELTNEFAHRPMALTLLLTHTHWDHIQGLPFFLPLLKPQVHIRILGFEGAKHGLDTLLTSQMESPFFPIGMRELTGNVVIEELKDLNFEVGPVRVHASFANHPGICVGYKISTNSGTIAFFPDNEPHLSRERWPQATGHALEHARAEHNRLVEFLRDTDVLVMDTQYDCEEYLEHLGWGHGCLDDVVSLAVKSRVKRLFLFHHDPDHDDEKVDRMLAHARQLAITAGSGLKVEAAQEGAVVEVGAAPIAENR